MAQGEGDMIGMLDRAKDWLLPLASGATPAAIFGWLAGRKKAEAETAKVAADATKATAEASKAEAEADAVYAGILNERFKALIDGYEKRIADLTAEVHGLRDEVKALRQALDSRTRAEAEDARRRAGLTGGATAISTDGDVRDLGRVV
ncbi:hypothetical protein EDE12_106127 [Methylosinus sp. sav-2]|nr:hypothetical protein EDE12_106127 [Methylosinus sp. sav-2]